MKIIRFFSLIFLSLSVYSVFCVKQEQITEIKELISKGLNGPCNEQPIKKFLDQNSIKLTTENYTELKKHLDNQCQETRSLVFGLFPKDQVAASSCIYMINNYEKNVIHLLDKSVKDKN